MSRAVAHCLELDLGLATALGAGDLDLELTRVVEELVQRRIEQADDHGQALHGLEHAKEVALLGLAELGESVCLDRGVVGKDEVLDEVLALAQEHVLGTAQADAHGAVVAGQLSVLGVVGVGADAHDAAAVLVEADLVSPLEDGLEVATELGTGQLGRRRRRCRPWCRRWR